jgi:hypothetical protein
MNIEMENLHIKLSLLFYMKKMKELLFKKILSGN